MIYGEKVIDFLIKIIGTLLIFGACGFGLILGFVLCLAPLVLLRIMFDRKP